MDTSPGASPPPPPLSTSLYLPLQLDRDGVQFIDFWNFITSDFSHGFSTRDHLDYRDPCIPSKITTASIISRDAAYRRPNGSERRVAVRGKKLLL
jgi:hypothetical protein